PVSVASTIVIESHKAGYDPFLVAAIIKSESAFRHTARSHVGAVGLMQILPSTGRYITRKHEIAWRGYRALLNPSYNIKLGIAYLKYLENKFNGDLEKVLIAYNWGPANLEQALSGKKRIPGGPKRYAKGILANYSTWSASFEELARHYSYLKLTNL
ncbi:MAG: lytic transglycosylase domain-containing protein, partial [Candidatus Dadabacteria bacterium]